MGSNESSQNQEKNTSDPKENTSESTSKNEEPKNVNIENNDNKNLNQNPIINDINFKGFTGGNSSKINNQEQKNENKLDKIENKFDLLSYKNIKEEKFPKFNEIKKFNKIHNKNKMNKFHMANKIDNKKNLNIEVDKKNYQTNNDPMMMTADNFHSKKIKFNDEQNKDKNEIQENKKVSPIKNIKSNFQINNENNSNINKDLLSNRKIMPRNKIFEGRRNQIKKYNLGNNFNTINNEENIMSLNKKILPFYNKKEIIKKKYANIKIDIEENININNEIKINNEAHSNKKEDDISENLNINQEIKKNKEDDDFDSNLNINQLSDSKQNEPKFSNLEIKINKNNENYDNRMERGMRRNNTLSNLLLNLKIPKKVFLFDNPNLFDSFLIILNHNYYIDKYLEKNTQKIENCDKKVKYCLSSILYYINKYLWTTKPETIISRNDISKKYKAFLDCYIHVNCKNSNPNYYLYDMNNIQLIISFIFTKINEEITAENINKQINVPQTNDYILNKFLYNFAKSNISIISDCFTGFYQEDTTCIYCQNKMQRYGNYYSPIRNYSEFNYITFNLSSNNGQMDSIQRMSTNSFNMNYNQYNYSQCYNNNNNCSNLFYYLEKQLNETKLSYCNLCLFKTQKWIQKKFYTLPNVLTFILNNNDGSFYINDEINLSKYTFIQGNHNYYLIAMLCKYSYDDTLITYCFNQKDGNWYYYTKNEIKVNKATSLDINAIPLVLVYQSVVCKELNYNKINLENANNKKGYHFRFPNSFPDAILYFGINDTVKDVKATIKRLYNFNNVEDIKLLFKGEKLKDEDLLCFVASNISPIVVFPIMS